MSKLLSLSLCALLTAATGLAQAAPREGDRGHRGDRDRYGYYEHDRGRRHDDDRDDRYDRRDDRYDRRHDRYDRRHDRWHERRHYSEHRYRAPRRYMPPRGYYARRWAPGAYLPRTYYAPVYVVDYRPYHLPPPRRGHHWVRVDNDVFLVALATGLVVDAVYDIFY